LWWYISAEAKIEASVLLGLEVEAEGELSVLGVVVVEWGGRGEWPAGGGVAGLAADGGGEAGACRGEVVEAVGIVLGVASLETGGLREGVLLFGGGMVQRIYQDSLRVE
jgi:hypothetical protein